MWQRLLKPFFFIPKFANVDADYIADLQLRNAYNENGFVVLKNAVDADVLQIIESAYAQFITQTFPDNSDFITSPNFGGDVQQAVQKQLSEVNQRILKKQFILEKCRSDFFSILVIKPKAENKYLSAHQDISFVDEQYGCSSFLWIPVDDINTENGAITVLPKSHKWARWQKTHNREISPLLKNNAWIQERMQPVFMQKGDALLFDASLIHGSLPNRSATNRIAMNTAICHAHLPLVHYECSDKKQAFVTKYSVDETFWRDFKFTQAVPTGMYASTEEPFIWNKPLSKWNLKFLLDSVS
ncbi:MAG: phytanoyl-CoA dioxygenase family protein [Chitinophagales bacterium]|nr:phytanoyl-CoA dioxygenase family protein [Bacteroidota bacterium]